MSQPKLFIGSSKANVRVAKIHVTFSKDEVKPSTRDNVLFECGLFMGKMGRDRVFIVYDKSVELKIPSDFAGITLAEYDGSRIKVRKLRQPSEKHAS